MSFSFSKLKFVCKVILDFFAIFVALGVSVFYKQRTNIKKYEEMKAARGVGFGNLRGRETDQCFWPDIDL